MKKHFFIGLFLLLAAATYTGYTFIRFNDHKLHMVFCNVGQGDGIFIRTPGGKTVLIDGGPDRRVLTCLQNHMPFWDRSITLMELTHPHADHLNGLVFVLERYSTKYFITEKLSNKTAGFNQLKHDLEMDHVQQKFVSAGDRVTIDGITLRIAGPSQDFLAKTSPGGIIGESKEFGSLITLISYGSFSTLLTGDSQVEGLSDSLSFLRTQGVTLRAYLDALQVPHHGSRFGLSGEIVQKLDPALAVISVGKNNYGHPSPKTMQLLESAKVPFLRTDQDGDIEIVSDGKQWWIVK